MTHWLYDYDSDGVTARSKDQSNSCMRACSYFALLWFTINIAMVF